MPIFNNEAGRKLLFIHIPKTGGTSIESWLSSQLEIGFYSTIIPSFMKCSPQHLMVDDYEYFFNEPFSDIFSIVRDPYDRLESEYFFKTRSLQKELKPKFNPWLRLHLKKTIANPYHFDNHFRPQTEFLNEEMKIFKYEDGFEKIIKYLTDYFELKGDLEFPNSNKSDRYKLHWSARSIQLVNDIYTNDFELLGYKKRVIQLDV